MCFYFVWREFGHQAIRTGDNGSRERRGVTIIDVKFSQGSSATEVVVNRACAQNDGSRLKMVKGDAVGSWGELGRVVSVLITCSPPSLRNVSCKRSVRPPCVPHTRRKQRNANHQAMPRTLTVEVRGCTQVLQFCPLHQCHEWCCAVQASMCTTHATATATATIQSGEAPF